MKNRLVYLASPYSSPDPATREARFQAVCACAAEMMRNGTFVLSPIAHTHPIAAHGLPGDWAYWERYDRTLLSHCDAMEVLRLPGWDTSVGVRAEIVIAEELGLPVHFRDESAGRACETGEPVWRNADADLPPLGTESEVLCGADSILHGSLVRLPSGDYAWANGADNEYRVHDVRGWRRIDAEESGGRNPSPVTAAHDRDREENAALREALRDACELARVADGQGYLGAHDLELLERCRELAGEASA